MILRKEGDVLPRKIGDCPKKPEKVNPHPGSETRTYEIQVITPIFGGGVKAGENDPFTPIRPSSIRGHLRFWWRATRGARCTTVAELRQREGEIWGTTECPSQVILEAAIISQGTTYPCAHIPEGKNFARFKESHPGYALFPCQGNKKDGTPIARCTSKISFKLKLTNPQSLCQDVNAAVWAWTNFGGVGARTRRGCGALYCQELSPSDTSSIESWYGSRLKSFDIVLNHTRGWPTLPDSLLVRGSSNVMQAWAEVVGIMQTFRQGQDVGRNPGASPNRPGRSRWPEPETIRSATSRRDPKHSRMPRIPNDAFPRAEFGLPIVFHFKDYGDPEDTELYPVVNGEEKTRMSSPLILRPMVCRNSEVQQMILCLRASSSDEVVLKKAPGSPTFTKIRDPTLNSYPQSPLGSSKSGVPVRSPSGSAIEGFLAYATENKFRVV
jgi:CRISPR-associated protein Cmr1